MKIKSLIICLMFLNTLLIYGQDESKGKIHGYMFGDYFYNFLRDENFSSITNSALKGDQDYNGFLFRRIYFGYDYTINKKFSTRFRLDANQSEITNGGKIGVFIKDAYIKWKNIFPGSDVILGISPPPTYVISESYWGYRSLAEPIMGLRKIASSRDFGISVKGNITRDGSLKYWIMAANGEGIKPEINKQKRIYSHLSVEPLSNLILTFYGDIGFREDIESLNANEMLTNNKITTAIFAGYRNLNSFSFGIEGFYQIFQNSLIGKTGFEDAKIVGLSIFGSMNIIDKISFVGRYDYYDPTDNSGYKGDKRNYFLTALNYKIDPKIWIMPNIIVESYENSIHRIEFDSAITGRITFFYKFY